MSFSPGCLVRVRERDWVVQPSDDADLLLLKPLGGTDEEVVGIYLPLDNPGDRPVSTQFSMPAAADLGNLQTSRLLFDATRLSFRNGAGPFRSLAKLSFRPRAYQMVPLVMALRQDPVRLLIADDVGVGKTVEALLILRELLERRIIRRFAVICLPHLCDQWQEEIRRKLDIEAAVIRSSTQARLDREIQGDTSVFEHYPYQVLSIDYIKAESRRDTFIHQCPELVIVDEVHACACPAGAPASQQQRHALLHGISAKAGQHLVMLTATPHSGKPEEFQSLLGLLRPEFEGLNLAGKVSEPQRKLIATHFIQRRRADVKQWASENTIFADRETKEIRYDLAPAQEKLFEEVLNFARGLVAPDLAGRRRRISYWTALALLRGVASSPAAGAAMLRARLERLSGDDAPDADTADEASSSPVHDNDPARDSGFENDISPVELMQENTWSDNQKRRLNELAASLESIATPAKDAKLIATARILEANLKDGFSTVVFCRYLATARYLGDHLPGLLRKTAPKVQVEVVTSEDPDDLRRERISAMGEAPLRVLIATDCLSEGINLQDLFSAVLHYDLPWNPNRLEQREGRVDRFGQTAPVVRATLLYGRNPVDGIVLDVILKKIREIRRSTGVAIAYPEDSRSIMDSIAQAVLFSPGRARIQDMNQLMLDLDAADETRDIKLKVGEKIKEAENREQLSRSIFAQHGIKADELEKDLREADEFIGSPSAVQEFAGLALAVLGVELTSTSKGFKLQTTNLPESIKPLLPPRAAVLVSFESPTPDGYLYLGRNHPVVEQLCHLIMRNTLAGDHQHGASRAAVIRSSHVKEKHTVYLCRCRNVIERPNEGTRIVAEEMLLWGYRGFHKEGQYLLHDEAKAVLNASRATTNLALGAASSALESEVTQVFPQLKDHMNQIAKDRSEHLVEAHLRFSQLLKDRTRYQVVQPVLPMDVLGAYIILPEIGTN
jgi:superfamily II DNA or RNA helicase